MSELYTDCVESKLCISITDQPIIQTIYSACSSSESLQSSALVKHDKRRLVSAQIRSACVQSDELVALILQMLSWHIAESRQVT